MSVKVLCDLVNLQIRHLRESWGSCAPYPLPIFAIRGENAFLIQFSAHHMVINVIDLINNQVFDHVQISGENRWLISVVEAISWAQLFV